MTTLEQNHDRAEWARVAVKAFRNVCRGSMKDGEPVLDEAVGDLIGDLLHLCEENGLDPLQIARHGISHYVAETFDDDGMGHRVNVDLTIQTKRYDSNQTWQEFKPVR